MPKANEFCLLNLSERSRRRRYLNFRSLETLVHFSHLLLAPLDDQAIAFTLFPGFVPFGGHSPGTAGMPSAGRPAFTATHGVINRIHSNTPYFVSPAQPAFAPGFAK
jgi:hypothetical protein